VQFEFKTKSAEIERLLDAYSKHSSVDTVAGFSVNIPEFNEKEEPGTVPIADRIEAAQKLSKAGIKIAIHFDPIVMLDRFFDDYIKLINDIFSRLDNSKVVWISMGGFRHTLSMTSTVYNRFPDSFLLQGEMFPSDSDNKTRYLAASRRRFYNAFIEEISKYFNGNPPLYMCMEKQFLWDDTGLKTFKPVF